MLFVGRLLPVAKSGDYGFRICPKISCTDRAVILFVFKARQGAHNRLGNPCFDATQKTGKRTSEMCNLFVDSSSAREDENCCVGGRLLRLSKRGNNYGRPIVSWRNRTKGRHEAGCSELSGRRKVTRGLYFPHKPNNLLKSVLAAHLGVTKRAGVFSSAQKPNHGM